MRIRFRALLITATSAGQSLVGLLIAVLLARTLGKAGYGGYQQAFMVGGLVFGLFAPHLSKSLYYFLVKDAPDGCRRHFANNLVAMTLITVASGGLVIAIAEPLAVSMNNPTLTDEIRLFALYPFIQGLLGQIGPSLIAIDRTWLASRLILLGMILRLGAVSGAALLSGEVLVVLAAHLLAGGVTIVVALPLAWRALPGARWRLDGALMREQIAYTGPLAAATLVGVLNVYLDRVLISAFYLPERFAVYAVGAIELPLIGFAVGALNTAMLPDLVSRATTGDRQGAWNLWRAGIAKSSLVLIPAALFFMLFGGDFIVALYGSEYSDGQWPLRVYLLRLPLRALTFGVLWRALNLTREIVWAIVIGVVVNLVLSLGLLAATHTHAFGFVAPAVGTVGGTLAAASWQVRRLGRMFEGPTVPLALWGRLLALSMIAALPALWLFAVDSWPALLRFGIACVLFACAFGPLATRRGLVTRDEWALIARIIPWVGLRARVMGVGDRLGRWSDHS